MTEKELVEALINVFEMRAHYWREFGQEDRALGIQECVNHLKAYLEFHL